MIGARHGARHLWAAVLFWSLAAAMEPALARSAIAPTTEQRLPDGQHVLVLCYHDVVAAVPAGADPETIDTATLASQLNWLQAEGYVAIDLDLLARAYAGTARLPERALLLTFDDGYESAYTQVFPLLRAYRMPAVMALVGKWMETDAGQFVPYGERQLAREGFLSWAQAREMQASGLIEFASHSWNLHHGVPGDAAGSSQPAATTHIALAAGGYEDDAGWVQRVRADLERNNALLTERLGRAPRAIVWPYGRYNAELETIAQGVGLTIGLTLDSGQRDQVVPISRLRRLLIDRNAGLIRFAQLVRQDDDAPTVRMVKVDLDRLASVDAGAFEQRLDSLIDRIRQLGAETVVLPACAAPGPSGQIDAVYFRNRRVPVRADILGRVAWRIATATPARVFASMPLAGFALDPVPGDADREERIGELFEDLGKAAYLKGVLLGPVTSDETLETLSRRAAHLAQRTRAWQPGLLSALHLTPTKASALPEQIRQVLQQHAYLLLDTTRDRGVISDGQLEEAVGSVQDAAARTVVAVAVRPGGAADADRRAQALLRSGLANLGVVDLDLEGDPAMLAALRRTLSLQSQLAARVGGAR